MKQIITILTLMLFVFGTNAQYIYNDFDANQNETFLGWPNAPTNIPNPDPTGVNTSANVGEWVRTTEQWAHIYCELDGMIDFSTGNMFTMKVWSPIACQLLFKLEDKTNSNVYVEAPYDLTSTSQWLEVSFDFTGAASGTYDKIVIFMDFASGEDNTYYIDDIEGPGYGGGPVQKPYLEVDVQDNFEDDGWATIDGWKFQDPELVDLTIVSGPVNPSNHVADYNRSGSFEYTNAQIELEHRMDLTSRNNFSIDVYFPSNNAYGDELTSTAAIKLQNSLMGANAWMTQTEIIQEVTVYDAWTTLSFDFSAVADSTIYDQIVIQFGGENHFVPAQFYFDNFQLMDPTGIEANELQQIRVYPNPVSDFIYLDGIEETKSINIYSVNGQLIKSIERIDQKIDVSDLKDGLYFISVLTTKGDQLSSRFIKK
jgi:hypothetical protein